MTLRLRMRGIAGWPGRRGGVMEERKVKHIQFIFDNGEYHTLSADSEQWKLAFTELDDLLMAKDLDGFAICITTKFGGHAAFATDKKSAEKGQEMFSEVS